MGYIRGIKWKLKDRNCLSYDINFLLLFACYLVFLVWWIWYRIQNMLRVMMQRLYEYALKWKINDTLHRYRSSEDTYTPIMYTTRSPYAKTNQNRFWGRSRHLQHNNSRCLKQSYDSLTDDHQNIFSDRPRHVQNIFRHLSGKNCILEHKEEFWFLN